MNKITDKIKEFLNSQNVGIFAIEMLDGSPHGATVHFAYTEDPFQFIFLTDRPYRKVEPLLGRKESRATFVVGFEEGANSKTFQLDGIARVLKPSEEHLKEIYLDKFEKKREKAFGENKLFFVFIPTWWRFSDFSKGREITLSQ
jgi:hypothetical protein